jgi:hypothetical protein
MGTATRSKKIFTGILVLFFVFLAGLIYDISSKTTFPGARQKAQQRKEQLEKAKSDSLKNASSPKSATHQP